MKLHELKKNQKFSADFYNPRTGDKESTVTAKLIKVDGGMAQIKYAGIDKTAWVRADTEVVAL